MATASSLPEFGDFDDGNVYETIKEGINRAESLNFVIEFDSSKACAAHNLGIESIKTLLSLEVSASDSIRSARSDEALFTHHLHGHCMDANLGMDLATKSFKYKMDVCRSLFMNCCNPDCAPSNIWAPETQKEVIEVCPDFWNCFFFSH